MQNIPIFSKFGGNLSTRGEKLFKTLCVFSKCVKKILWLTNIFNYLLHSNSMPSGIILSLSCLFPLPSTLLVPKNWAMRKHRYLFSLECSFALAGGSQTKQHIRINQGIFKRFQACVNVKMPRCFLSTAGINHDASYSIQQLYGY